MERVWSVGCGVGVTLAPPTSEDFLLSFPDRWQAAGTRPCQ